MKRAALSDGLQIEFAGWLVVQREAPDVNIRIDRRRVRRTGTFENEVGAAFHRETVGLDSLDLGEVEILTRKVKMERASGGLIGGASGDDRFVVEEMQVVESDFALGEVEIGIELPDAFTVGEGVGDVDLSVAARVRNGSRGLDRKIGFAGDGIVVSNKSLKGRKIRVVKVGAERKGAVGGDMAMLQSC